MKTLAIIKKRFVKGMSWALSQYDLFVGLACLCLILSSMLIMFSWLVGYWCNGLLGTKFELQSCLQGIGAVGTGVGSLFALIKANVDKYKIDSQFNSKRGETPTG